MWEKLEECLTEYPNSSLMVYQVDINNFREVNDTYGPRHSGIKSCVKS